jgi:hypothetical protein
MELYWKYKREAPLVMKDQNGDQKGGVWMGAFKNSPREQGLCPFFTPTPHRQDDASQPDDKLTLGTVPKSSSQNGSKDPQ